MKGLFKYLHIVMLSLLAMLTLMVMLSFPSACSDVKKNHKLMELSQSIAFISAAVQENDELTGFTPIAEDGAITAYKVTFSTAGEVIIPNGSSIISVTEDAVRVIFIFDDGTQITIPKQHALGLSLDGDGVAIGAGETICVSYTIEGAEISTITVLCGNGWNAKVNQNTATTGTIEITAPTPVSQDKVIVFASDGKGRVVAVEMNLTVDTSGNPEPPTPSDPELILKPVPEAYEVPIKGGEIVVALITNVDYIVDISEPWLHYNGTKAVRTDKLSFWVEENDSVTRTALATISSENYSTSIIFRQAGNSSWIHLSDSSFNFGMEGGRKLLTVDANIVYDYQVSEEWVSIELAEGVTGSHYIVAVEPNPSITARTARIVFSGNNVEPQVLDISQGGQFPYLFLTGGPYSFGVEGGTSMIKAVSNVDYSYTLSQESDWISIVENNSEEMVYYVSIKPNDTFKERTATIIFTGEDIEPQIITIFQGASLPYMVVSRKQISFGCDGGEGTFYVISNIVFSVAVSQDDWLAVEEKGKDDSGRMYYSITVASNPSVDARNATITFTGGLVESHTIHIGQEGQEPYMSLSADAIGFDGTGGTESLLVKANVPYSYTSDASWVTISKSASEDNVLIITAGANNSYQKRDATITFTSEGLEETTVLIWQNEKQAPQIPHSCIPVCHIMPCCRTNNAGTRFLVNDRWNSAHDYSHIDEVRSILQHIKDAGINIVCIDFTNASQWDDIGQSALHNGDGGEFWQTFHPMLDNIVKVCAEKDMKYCLFLGNTLAPTTTLEYWNFIAGIVLERWASDPSYLRYGFGDDRPMLVMFVPGSSLASQLRRAPASQKNNLEQFHIGTCQVNSPITPTPTDGWGYRNYSQSSDGKVRFACPNGGVPPQDWYRVDADEWQRRVAWALGASEYAVLGSYDDTCDAIFWGIADVRRSISDYHRNNSTLMDPYVYYNIVRNSLE